MPVLVVLARFSMVVMMLFMGMRLLVGVRRRVPVAVTVIVSSMAVVSKTGHPNQVYG